MGSRIGVINYGAGNLGSVMNALTRLGLDAAFAAGPEDIRASLKGGASRGGAESSRGAFDAIIFPGDGHFATAMDALNSSGYADALREWIAADRPFLGICIGLQLLFEYSEEAGYAAGNSVNSANAAGNSAAVKGLGVIPGVVKKFPGRKVPQIGWNQTQALHGEARRLFRNIPRNSFFYYIHSYYAAPEETFVTAATANYYVDYCAAVEIGSLAAVQFHPEKSGEAGLALLRNWIEQ